MASPLNAFNSTQLETLIISGQVDNIGLAYKK